ncbi:SDR family NAD(P)-dependent oxidoreductase [Actinomadura sp. 9N215]|uniref:SDR family NAD(P)-dependent oxidoreductase n=1 Tax=Actinomadura sp. 9N215 TaxID=3375150 RepID=UPI0037B137F8
MNADLSLAGRTAIVTGAGAGLGRAEAVALAARGANVVVNDKGPAADDVAAEIRRAGGEAVAVKGDVGDWSMGDTLVSAAVDTFGSLDVLVNNAGVLRDRMLFNLSESDWDDVIRVHLKGHAAVSRAAAAHWRAAAKAADGPGYGRVINTASEAFLFGGAGQANYAAAKAGIVALTLSTSAGLGRYGVRANAICPRARTAMTEETFAAGTAPGGLDVMAPERVGGFVGYLASPAAEKISGQVFVVYGDMVALMAAPTVERKFTAPDGVFSVEDLDAQLTPYFQDRGPHRTYAAHNVAELDDTRTTTMPPEMSIPDARVRLHEDTPQQPS